jgi:hypothetical protein
VVCGTRLFKTEGNVRDGKEQGCWAEKGSNSRIFLPFGKPIGIRDVTVLNFDDGGPM